MSLENSSSYDKKDINLNLLDDPVKIKQSSKWHKAQITIACIIKFILVIIAGHLCWKCNSGENVFIRIIFTMISSVFSEIYILYYAVYRVYMGRSCNI